MSFLPEHMITRPKIPTMLGSISGLLTLSKHNGQILGSISAYEAIKLSDSPEVQGAENWSELHTGLWDNLLRRLRMVAKDHYPHANIITDVKMRMMERDNNETIWAIEGTSCYLPDIPGHASQNLCVSTLSLTSTLLMIEQGWLACDLLAVAGEVYQPDHRARMGSNYSLIYDEETQDRARITHNASEELDRLGRISPFAHDNKVMLRTSQPLTTFRDIPHFYPDMGIWIKSLESRIVLSAQLFISVPRRSTETLSKKRLFEISLGSQDSTKNSSKAHVMAATPSLRNPGIMERVHEYDPLTGLYVSEPSAVEEIAEEAIEAGEIAEMLEGSEEKPSSFSDGVSEAESTSESAETKSGEGGFFTSIASFFGSLFSDSAESSTETAESKLADSTDNTDSSGSGWFGGFGGSDDSGGSDDFGFFDD